MTPLARAAAILEIADVEAEVGCWFNSLMMQKTLGLLTLMICGSKQSKR
jgi:hypothetical protein